jgi:hypothetical protein
LLSAQIQGEVAMFIVRLVFRSLGARTGPKEGDVTTAFLFMEILKEEDHHDPFTTSWNMYDLDISKSGFSVILLFF